MTEIEMDIDMAKPVLDGKIEDDFIDFDTDMVDSNHDLQKNDDNLESMDREMQEDEDAVNHEAYETNGITGEDVDFDLHDVEDTANSPEHVDYEVTEAPELGTQGPIQTAQPPDEDVPENEEKVEILDEIIVHGDAVSDDHESTHEIDYEFEDNAESEDSHQDEKTAAASRATRSEPNGIAGAAEEQDDHEPENDATATGQELSDHTGDENNISSHNDQNEPRDPKEEEAEPDEVATGEAEAEDVKADEYNVENTHASGDNDEIHDGEDANSHEETTTLASGQNDETTEAVEEAEDHDYDAGEHVADAYDEHATTDTDHVDHSATGEDSNGKTDEGFPAITVQYKGDEFPMFSTTTHGFFANTSVLDEPLEKLIAGLRSELENEIAEDDDLVLQVDELGLELVETTQGETMSNVTLRQILEIFDLLVKNQDPDGSRPLYAYLFTKPNAEKRFEYLVESATAGKGLDEVIHLFETPMTAGTSMLETAATIDGVHEELDEFDSPIDDEHHSEIDEAENEDEYLEGEHANPDATGSEGQEFKDQEVDDHEVNSQQANNQDGHYEDDQDNINVATDTQIEISVNASAVDLEDPETAVDSLTAADEDGLEQNGKATSLFSTFLCCYYPDFCLCAPCVSEYVETHNKDEAEFRKTVKCNYGTMQILSPKVQYLRPHQSKHHRSLSDFSTTYSFNNTDEFTPARADSEIDPFANFELDEEAEFNGDVALGENTETQDEVNVDAEPEPLHAQTNDTSTTTTLQEEEEASSFNVDLGVASATVETAEKSKTDDDDLDEIDWRDEHEPEDQAPSTPSAAGKRARGDDDDVDAEDEQDAKRRRP